MSKKGRIISKNNIKCYVLEFDAIDGKYKKNNKGKYVLNYKNKIDCISIVDARMTLGKYFRPAQIPTYAKCREIIKKEGFLSVMNLRGKYMLG